jgi:protein-S-isoprenylcysteine O-methyltransferase Ste14
MPEGVTSWTDWLAAARYVFAVLAEDLGFRPLLAACGVPLLAVAGWIAWQRKRHLTLRILLGIPELSSDPADSKLLDEGIYSRIRHPRYVEFILGLVGWSLVLSYLGFYWMTAATVVAILLIVPLEERELRDRFGAAYEDYALRVPRYLPRRRSGR